MEVIRAISRVPTDMYEHPRIPVHFFDCGQMDKDGLRPLKDIEVVQEEESEVARYERLKASKATAKPVV
jgi:hypothetical protein